MSDEKQIENEQAGAYENIVIPAHLKPALLRALEKHLEWAETYGNKSVHVIKQAAENETADQK